MKYLLDTHFMLWVPIDDRRISSAARSILNNAENELLFSAASIWEIAIKRSQMREDFVYEPRLLRAQLIENGYQELSINGQHAVAVESLPPIHKDPFDRILIAQAMVEGIMLLTSDSTIARYPTPICKV